MDFYEGVTHSLYCRLEDGPELAAPLENGPEYKKSREELLEILNNSLDNESTERAMNAARRLCDLSAQYFYRVGLQDGVRLTAEDFPVRGISA